MHGQVEEEVNEEAAGKDGGEPILPWEAARATMGMGVIVH